MEAERRTKGTPSNYPTIEPGYRHTTLPYSATPPVQTNILPFGGGDGRSVYLKLIRVRHEGRGRFQGTDVRSVTQLCLRIAPNHL